MKKNSTWIWLGLGTVAASGIGWFIFKAQKDKAPAQIQTATAPRGGITNMFPSQVTPITTALSRRVPIEPPMAIKDPKRMVTYLPTDTHEQRVAKKRRAMLLLKKEAKRRTMQARISELKKRKGAQKKLVIPIG